MVQIYLRLRYRRMSNSNFQLSDELCDELFRELAESGMLWQRPVLSESRSLPNRYGEHVKIAQVTSSPTIIGSQVTAGIPSGRPASG